LAKISKATEISNVKIQFVSLVDKAANLRTFLIKKANDGKASFTTCGRIVKADSGSHHVTGIVYEPMAEDSQGNFMTEDEITKAAYWFAKNSGQVDIQHSFKPFKGGTVVESWIAKADFSIEEEQVKKGTWLMTVEVEDQDVWESIEKGEITGFSMGGVGNYSKEDVDLDSVNKKDAGEKRGLFKQLAKAFGLDVVEKGDVSELYGKRTKDSQFWNAFSALEDALRHWDGYADKTVYEDNGDKIREYLTDFNQIITDLLTTDENITKSLMEARPVEKAGKKMSNKNKETLSGIYESLGAFLKEFDDPEKETDNSDEKKNGEKFQEPEDDDKEKENEDVSKSEVQKMVNAAIAKAIQNASQTINEPAANITKKETITPEQVQTMIDDSVAKALEPLLKSKGLPSNLGTGTGSVEKQEQHYLHGIL